jgi:hypothetical protein
MIGLEQNYAVSRLVEKCQLGSLPVASRLDHMAQFTKQSSLCLIWVVSPAYHRAGRWGNSAHRVRRSFPSHREEMRSLERTISYTSNI